MPRAGHSAGQTGGGMTTVVHSGYEEAVQAQTIAKEPRESKTQAARNVSSDEKRAVVERYNREHAVVLIGGSVAILREGVDPHGRPEMRLLTLDAFRQWTATDLYWTDRDRPIPASMLWLGSEDRRQYEGIVFQPGRTVPGNYYNLWRGFSVEPKPGTCDRVLAHLAENVCSGDEQLFAWVLGWFAQLVQRPWEKLGTALVLRGQQGTGKTIVGEIVGSLLGAHYQLVSDPRYVSGRFNSHLASCLLLQLDEGVWGGDHVAAGKLKDLITGRDQLIEYKGKEPVRVDNFTRLFITSNSDWVIPAGLDERRFAVIDVGDGKRQDGSYFAAIRKEMRDGGREALLYHLMHLELADIPLRDIPRTGALRDQQIASLSPELAWWMDILMDGALPGDITGEGLVSTNDLYRSYVQHAQTRGVNRRSGGMQLRNFLNRYAPGVTRTRRGSGARGYNYQFPALAACRAAFACESNAAIDWGEEHDTKWEPSHRPMTDDEVGRSMF